MTLLEYRNRLYHSAYNLRNKTPIGARYEVGQKIRKKQDEDYKKYQFINKLLLAKGDSK